MPSASAPEPSPSILLLGNPGAPEFRSLPGLVRCHFPEANILRTEVRSEGVPRNDPVNSFDLVIATAAHPDTWSVADVNQIFERYPLARILCCLGLWCEAIGRSRDTWPAATRVKPSLWSWRLAHEASAMRHGLPPLPRTASREETYRRLFLESVPMSPSNRLPLHIDSPDPAYHQLLRTWRIQTGRLSDDPGPGVCLFDLDPWPDRRPMLERVLARGAEVIALSDWLPQGRRDELHDLGVRKMLEKLDPLSLLEQMIDRDGLSPSDSIVESA